MSRILSMLLVVLIAVCCSHGVKYNSGEYYDSKNDQIANFERDLAVAREHELDKQAGKEFALALKSFSKAKEIAREAEDEDDLKDFREEMHEARMNLDRAYEVAKTPAQK